MNYFDSFLASKILCCLSMLYVNPSPENELSSDADRLLKLIDASLTSFLLAFSFKLLLKPLFEIYIWLPDMPLRKLPDPMDVESL